MSKFDVWLQHHWEGRNIQVAEGNFTSLRPEKMFFVVAVFFLIMIHSMQGLTATMRHGGTWKKQTQKD